MDSETLNYVDRAHPVLASGKLLLQKIMSHCQTFRLQEYDRSVKTIIFLISGPRTLESSGARGPPTARFQHRLVALSIPLPRG